MIKALILAAGKGTRLRPLTDTIPKCLVPIAGRPLLGYWLEKLMECGVKECLINTHAHKRQMRRYIAAFNDNGNLRLIESHEPTLLGSAGTVSANADFAEDAEQVIIIYADNFSNVDLSEMLSFHLGHNEPLTMLLFESEDPSRCGIAQMDETGRIIDFIEKPSHPSGNLANGGVYIIDSSLYRKIAEARAFDLGFDVLPRLAGRMKGWVWPGYHRDIGTIEAYLQAVQDADRILNKTQSNHD
jgi:mannose-1-phosphate guanylyltransferase